MVPGGTRRRGQSRQGGAKLGGEAGTRSSAASTLFSSLWAHLTIGGYQDFWPPIQVHVGDQATEDTVKLVAAGQKQLIFQALAQQVTGGPEGSRGSG